MRRRADVCLIAGNGMAIRAGEVTCLLREGSSPVATGRAFSNIVVHPSVDFRRTNTQYEVDSGNAGSLKIGIGARSDAVGVTHKGSVDAGNRAVAPPEAGA